MSYHTRTPRNFYRRYHRPFRDYRFLGTQLWVRCGLMRKPHLIDGSVETLDPEFDWPDETWVAFHFETHCSIGTDPYESRALFDEPQRL
jgi:hypothetical protein